MGFGKLDQPDLYYRALGWSPQSGQILRMQENSNLFCAPGGSPRLHDCVSSRAGLRDTTGLLVDAPEL